MTFVDYIWIILGVCFWLFFDLIGYAKTHCWTKEDYRKIASIYIIGFLLAINSFFLFKWWVAVLLFILVTPFIAEFIIRITMIKYGVHSQSAEVIFYSMIITRNLSMPYIFIAIIFLIITFIEPFIS